MILLLTVNNFLKSNLIFGHKLHIGMYGILWEAFLDPSDSYFLFADLVGFYTHWTDMHIFRHICLSNFDGRNLIFRHNLHISTQYCGSWTRHIPICQLNCTLSFHRKSPSHFFWATTDHSHLIFVSFFIISDWLTNAGRWHRRRIMATIYAITWWPAGISSSF